MYLHKPLPSGIAIAVAVCFETSYIDLDCTQFNIDSVVPMFNKIGPLSRFTLMVILSHWHKMNKISITVLISKIIRRQTRCPTKMFTLWSNF